MALIILVPDLVLNQDQSPGEMGFCSSVHMRTIAKPGPIIMTVSVPRSRSRRSSRRHHSRSRSRSYRRRSRSRSRSWRRRRSHSRSPMSNRRRHIGNRVCTNRKKYPRHSLSVKTPSIAIAWSYKPLKNRACSSHTGLVCLGEHCIDFGHWYCLQQVGDKI